MSCDLFPIEELTITIPDDAAIPHKSGDMAFAQINRFEDIFCHVTFGISREGKVIQDDQTIAWLPKEPILHTIDDARKEADKILREIRHWKPSDEQKIEI